MQLKAYAATGMAPRSAIELCGGASIALRLILLLALLAGASSAVADEATCGAIVKTPGGFGPFDYRTATRDSIRLVEDFHFTPDVEMLKKGATGNLGGDLNYTLQVFPNHPRALASMMALQFKLKSDKPPGAKWPVACYFDRAIRFAPNDGNVRTVLGVYLMRLNQTAQAIAQFKVAEQLGEDSGNLHYNLGLAYFDVSDFPSSVEHAKKAYALGFTLPGLKNKLVKAGKWPAD